MSETLHVPYQRDNHATGIITADRGGSRRRSGERSVRVLWRREHPVGFGSQVGDGGGDLHRGAPGGECRDLFLSERFP